MSKLGGGVSAPSMISFQRWVQSSQMWPPGPAISFLTCRCDLPQKEQRSCSFESVGRAISLSVSEHLVLGDHPIDDAVLRRLFRAHEVIALGIAPDLVVFLPGVVGDDAVEALADVDDLLGVDLDVGGLTLEARADLVDEDLRVWQRHALALRAAGQQQRAHRHGDADADRRHVGLDELHRVVDREAGVDAAARRVDVDRDVLVGVLALQMEQLGHDEVCDLVVHRRPEENDALVEQTGGDVERAFTTRGLLDNHRDKWAHGPRFGSLSAAPVLPGGWRASLLMVGFRRKGLERYWPGVQSRPPAPSSSSPDSGVQSNLRAWACSTEIGLAWSTSQSTASFWARSALSSSRRPACWRRSRSFSTVVSSRAALACRASRTSPSE